MHKEIPIEIQEIIKEWLDESYNLGYPHFKDKHHFNAFSKFYNKIIIHLSESHWPQSHKEYIDDSVQRDFQSQKNIEGKDKS